MDIQHLLNTTSAGQIAKQLDAKDGKTDGKISASIWNEFVKDKGGKQIQNYINVENAMNSITTYAVRNAKTQENTSANKLASGWLNGLKSIVTNQPAVSETPVVETPVVETPVVETPVVETPVVETPVVETPVVETPVNNPQVTQTEVTSTGDNQFEFTYQSVKHNISKNSDGTYTLTNDNGLEKVYTAEEFNHALKTYGINPETITTVALNEPPVVQEESVQPQYDGEFITNMTEVLQNQFPDATIEHDEFGIIVNDEVFGNTKAEFDRAVEYLKTGNLPEDPIVDETSTPVNNPQETINRRIADLQPGDSLQYTETLSPGNSRTVTVTKKEDGSIDKSYIGYSQGKSIIYHDITSQDGKQISEDIYNRRLQILETRHYDNNGDYNHSTIDLSQGDNSSSAMFNRLKRLNIEAEIYDNTGKMIMQFKDGKIYNNNGKPINENKAEKMFLNSNLGHLKYDNEN